MHIAIFLLNRSKNMKIFIIVSADVLHQSFSTFSVPEVVRLTDLKDDLTVVELFHGRSLAFKDLAMSCMGHFYKYYLTQSQKHMNLLVCK